MEKESRFIERKEVLPETEETLEKLELDTNELYRLKVESQAILDRLKPYLPEVTIKIQTRSGETVEVRRPATWYDIARWHSEGKLENMLREAIARELSPDDQIKLERRVKARLDDVQRGLGLLQQIEQAEEIRLLRHYKWFRLRELVLARKALSQLEEAMNKNRQMLEDAREQGDLEDIIRLEEEYRDLYEEYQQIIRSSPEAYVWKTAQTLLEIKRVFDENGTIVETPYVKTKIAHILDHIRQGRPVFIHGELSTGKTELAKHIARKYLSGPYLERWERENPRPTDPEALKEWEKRREAVKEPLIVRGMRGLEKEDILARTVLEREKTPLPEEQVKFLIEAKERFRKEVIERAAQEIKDPKERERFIQDALETLERAYMEKWRSGIITVEQLSPIFQAMEEGRVVIIDEMNAIPHHVLIVLNDIITRKPGDVVFTPSGRPIVVQEGFAIIATGNWKPEDQILYPGRSILDAAFLSRFGLEEYDYLPQLIQRESTTDDPEVIRKERQENELFMMLMVRLLDDQLGATLPENSIKKIKELARIARVIQDVFSGKAVETAFWARGGKINPKEVLKENVLAYRQLIPILEMWKRDGFRWPLDVYIFLHYIKRSSERPEEMKYLYGLLQIQGGFFQNEDWPQSTGESDEDITAIRNHIITLEKRTKGVDPLSRAKQPVPKKEIKLRYYSPLEIIEEIFGPIPKRSRYTRTLLESLSKPQSEEPNDEETIEALREIEEYKRSILEDPTIPEDVRGELRKTFAE
jgi:MoxR-like ATPase